MNKNLEALEAQAELALELLETKVDCAVFLVKELSLLDHIALVEMLEKRLLADKQRSE